MPPRKSATKAKSKSTSKRRDTSSSPKSSAQSKAVRKFRRPDNSYQLVVPGVEGSELADVPEHSTEVDAGVTP